MSIFNTLTSVFWIILVLYWLISSIGVKKTVRSGNWWYGVAFRVVFIIVFIVLAKSHTLNVFFITKDSITLNFVANIIGIILTAFGTMFALWARVHLGKNWGMPMSQRENPDLVTTGPYHFVRHPIYTGVLFAMLGSFLVQGNIWIIIFVCAGAYFIFSAKKEEQLMLKEFPNQYPLYIKKTKRLLPFIF